MDVHKTGMPIEGVGKVIISTSDIDYICQPETCLFWAGHSCIVEQYMSWPEAIQGHVAWTTDAARVAKAIHEYLRRE